MRKSKRNKLKVAPVMAIAIAMVIGGYFAHKRWETQYVPFSDQEILDFAYPGTRELEEFYKKDYESGSVYHENTISVTPTNERGNDMKAIRLCTDDEGQAFRWSDEHNEDSSQKRSLVSERETEKYFEFKRVYEEQPSNILLSRVDKCSYLDLSEGEGIPPVHTWERYKEGGRGILIGKFNQRPITLDSVSEMIPYLRHSFVVYNNNPVVESSVVDRGSRVEYTIYEIKKTVGDSGFAGGRDTISLVKSKYTVDKNSGEIHLFIGIIREIAGH